MQKMEQSLSCPNVSSQARYYRTNLHDDQPDKSQNRNLSLTDFLQDDNRQVEPSAQHLKLVNIDY